MAEDLRLPAELLDDGFFHDFFVDGNDEVRNFVVRINPPWICVWFGDPSLDLGISPGPVGAGPAQ